MRVASRGIERLPWHQVREPMQKADEEPVTDRDRRLLSLWQSGDQQAGLRLVRHYQPLIHRLAVGRGVRHPDDLEDLQGELVLELVRRRDDFWVETSFANCVHVAFRSAFRRFLRSRRSEGADLLDGVAAEETDGLAEREHREKLVEAVLRCAGRLGRGEYDLFASRIFEERSYEDLAESSGAAVGALRTRFHRALSKVRDCVEHKWKERRHGLV